MYGFPWIDKKRNLHNIVQSHQFQMLLVSISIGVISGLFIAFVRLNLGMPGHKAFFWMTPLLIARLRGGCKIGTSVGGLFAALTAYSFGANLAGGLIGLPLIVLAGAILDLMVNFLEKNKIFGWSLIPILGLAGAVANIVCLAKRMILPVGINPHFILGVSGFWFRFCSFTFFGLLSGVTAATINKLIRNKQLRKNR